MLKPVYVSMNTSYGTTQKYSTTAKPDDLNVGLFNGAISAA
jgi:hypothetical protein